MEFLPLLAALLLPLAAQGFLRLVLPGEFGPKGTKTIVAIFVFTQAVLLLLWVINGLWWVLGGNVLMLAMTQRFYSNKLRLHMGMLKLQTAEAATPEQISNLMMAVVREYPNTEAKLELRVPGHHLTVRLDGKHCGVIGLGNIAPQQMAANLVAIHPQKHLGPQVPQPAALVYQLLSSGDVLLSSQAPEPLLP